MAGKNESASALFALALEEDMLEKVKSDLEALSAALKENPDYIKLLDTPALSKEERLSLIDEAFSSLCECVRNLLKILCEKHLVYTVAELCSSFISLYDEHSGIERVEAVSAVALTAMQADAIIKKLAAMTQKKIILTNTVKPEILGGVILRYSGIQLDGSVKARLNSFAESLKNLNL